MKNIAYFKKEKLPENSVWKLLGAIKVFGL